MAARGWLGLPFIVWAAVCLVIAGVWAFVWPRERVIEAGPLRFFLVRWGHSLTWGFLAVMCLLRATDRPALAGWANGAGLAALASYLAFLAASFFFRYT